VADTTWAVGIDVGGTFTDAVAVRADGLVRTAKVPSTPDDPARGLLDAMAALTLAGVTPGAVTRVVHGTTVATNALLTGSLARVVLCATDGFRDVLAIRDGQRPAMYDLFQPRPRELVVRRDRLVVQERIAGDGTILEPLAAAEIERVVAAVRRRRPAAVAISLLFSFIEPAHERALGEALRRALPGVPVVVSSEVAREFREYPRTATTVIAAGLGPVVGRYLDRAAAGVAALGVPGSLLIMESGGGLVVADRAAREPHRLLLSGPAGGVGGAIEIGQRLGLTDLLTLDMGGTSVDVCLVRGGHAPRRATQAHDGVPVLAPALDIATAGAGGGSVAWLDPAGALRVGPRSSGADPGPAAYGRGGTEPTITDAHLITGGLDESTPLAGSVRMDRSAAEGAIATLAGPLGLSLEETARGILAIATAHIAGAIRRVSIERGIDPRGLPLVAFGGAGPLLAPTLMRDLRLAEVVVPPTPGLLSAAGLVGADLRFDESQTLLLRFGSRDEDRLLAWLRTAAADLERRLSAEGVAPGNRRLAAVVDCRYLGQGYELSVPVPAISRRAVRELPQAFHRAHREAYGHDAPDEPVEAVTARLVAIGVLPHAEPARVARGARGGRPDAAADLGLRTLVAVSRQERVRARLWRRDDLRAGDRLIGPAIVEQLDATTIIPTGMVGRVGAWGEIRIREART